MRRRGAEGAQLPADRGRRPSTARCRTPSRATWQIPRDALVVDRLGRAARRLLLGLHADVRHRRRSATRRARSTSSCCARSRRRWPRCARARRAEVDAVAREIIDGGGPRRALRPRARPRRRAGGARGAAAVAPRRRAALEAGQRRHGRAGGLPPGRVGRADRGPRRRDARRARRALDAAQDAAGHRLMFPLIVHHGTPGAGVPYAPFVRRPPSAGCVRGVLASRATGPGARTRAAALRAVPLTSRAILDALGAERCYTLGWSGGGPHALACAALLGGPRDQGGRGRRRRPMGCGGPRLEGGDGGGEPRGVRRDARPARTPCGRSWSRRARAWAGSRASRWPRRWAT